MHFNLNLIIIILNSAKYEKEGKYKRQIDAYDLWGKILESQIETGMPYMCYKDNVNNKSNQKELSISLVNVS